MQTQTFFRLGVTLWMMSSGAVRSPTPSSDATAVCGTNIQGSQNDLIDRVLRVTVPHTWNTVPFRLRPHWSACVDNWRYSCTEKASASTLLTPLCQSRCTYVHCEIGWNLVHVLFTDRKSHTSFWLVPKSLTLSDLEGRNIRYFAYTLNASHVKSV